MFSATAFHVPFACFVRTHGAHFSHTLHPFVFPRQIQGFIESARLSSVLTDELIGVILFLEGPFGGHGHHALLLAADGPEGLFRVDQFFSVVVGNLYGFDFLVLVAVQFDGGAIEAAEAD
jgi:hypothetical protein